MVLHDYTDFLMPAPRKGKSAWNLKDMYEDLGGNAWTFGELEGRMVFGYLV